MKKFGKKRVFERLTVDAYISCNCNNVACSNTCSCTCQCSCIWSPLSFALTSVNNESTFISTMNGIPIVSSYTRKHDVGIVSANFIRKF